MHKYEQFWIATMIRGGIALLVGSAILVMPDMSTTLLLLPFAVAFSILGLVAYGVLDSAVVLITSFLTPMRRARLPLLAQGLAGVTVGVALFTTLFEQVHLHWFLYLIGLQAVFASCSEFIIARHSSVRHGSRLDYAAAAIAMVCGVTYLAVAAFAEKTLTPHEITWVAYAYLGAFGTAQCLGAGRKLYMEHQGARVLHAGTR